MDPNPYESPAAAMAVLSAEEPLYNLLTLAWSAAAFLVVCALTTGVIAATSLAAIVLAAWV